MTICLFCGYRLPPGATVESHFDVGRCRKRPSDQYELHDDRGGRIVVRRVAAR